MSADQIIATLALVIALTSGSTAVAETKAGSDPSSSDEIRHEQSFSNRRKREPQNKRRGSFGHKRFERFPGLRELMESLPAEERQRLRELHKTDRTAFREELKKIFQKARHESQKEHDELRSLLSDFRDAEFSERKAELKAKLRAITEKQFNQKMASNKKHLEELEKKLETLKRQFEERKKQADDIINARVEELTRDPNLNW